MTTSATMRVAMIHEVFHDDPSGASLRAHLEQARSERADVAVLPELPLNSWAPYSKVAHDEDAELFGGARQQVMTSAASELGIGLVGGVILRDSDTGTRHNTAVVYGSDGSLLASYRKIHLPEEEGYWETSHYQPGHDGPEIVDDLPLRTGLQICSDVNRPQGVQLLAAQGAEAVLAPRATPPGSWERWRMVLRANAVMSGCYVISVNRPRSEHGAPIGGPSIAIAPSGAVLAETEAPVTIVELARSEVAAAAEVYPGYLPRYPDVYARAWGRLAD